MPGLRYRLVCAGEDDNAPPVVEWLGATAISTASLLTPPNVEAQSALSEAREFLEQTLQEGARPAEDVTSRAREAGISRSTLARARRALGVCSEKTGFGSEGSWLWSLPLRETGRAPTDA